MDNHKNYKWFVTAIFSWRWIFYIQIPLGFIGLIITWKVITEDKVTEKKEKYLFDFPGAILNFLGLSLMIYSLSMGEQMGWTSNIIISCFITSLILLTIMIFREKKHIDPLLDLNIFKNLAFTYPLLSRFFAAIS